MSEEKDPMTAPAPEFDPAASSPERSAEQVGHDAWPKPGDEGYVHPDGTPQAARQLEENQQAAADRAAAGSIIHGAPAVQHGGNPAATDIAVERARAYSGPSVAERNEALTESIREGQDVAEQRQDEAAQSAQADPANAPKPSKPARTADDTSPKTQR